MSVVSLYPENEFNGNPRSYIIDPKQSITTFILYNDIQQALLVRSVLNNIHNYVITV